MNRTDARCLPKLPVGQEWRPVQTGESGDAVYRRSDGAAYAKLATGIRVSSLENERRRTEWLAAAGIACPAVLDWTVSDTHGCLVTHAVPGVPASELSPSPLREALPDIVRLLKALHDLPVTACPFERELTRMFRTAEDVVARGAVNPEFLSPEDRDTPPTLLLERLRGEMPRRVAQESEDLVVCHGDACLPNFLINPATLRCEGMIDLGRLGTADRYVDFSLLLASAEESWDSASDSQVAYSRLFDAHAVAEPDRERLAFYLRLDPLTWG